MRTSAYSMLVLLAVSYAADNTLSGQTGPVAMGPCQVAGIARKARCGSMEVTENPGRRDGRKLTLHFVVLPAAGRRSLQDPIVPLMGGPGESAISEAKTFADRLAPLLNDRDLLLLDQRGAGQSSALRCRLFSSENAGESLQSLFPLAAVKSYTEKLGRQTDLTQYSYANFADDLEALRRGLGYRSLNLFAASYGTRAAQVFVRRYESSVRTMYLGSVVPIDIPFPLPFAEAAQRELERTFSACEAETACRARFPHFRQDFGEVMKVLESGQVRVKLEGQPETILLSQGRVAEWIRSLLYRPSSAARLPWLIGRARMDDWQPIVEGILKQAQNIDSELSLGLMLSITCNEDVAFIPENQIAPATRNTSLGDWRVRQQQAACRVWPRYLLPDGYREPIKTQVPTMFVSGTDDGGVPAEISAHAMAGFSRHVELIMSNRGHTEWDTCLLKPYGRFLATASIDKVDTSSCSSLPRPAFELR